MTQRPQISWYSPKEWAILSPILILFFMSVWVGVTSFQKQRILYINMTIWYSMHDKATFLDWLWLLRQDSVENMILTRSPEYNHQSVNFHFTTMEREWLDIEIVWFCLSTTWSLLCESWCYNFGQSSGRRTIGNDIVLTYLTQSFLLLLGRDHIYRFLGGYILISVKKQQVLNIHVQWILKTLRPSLLTHVLSGNELEISLIIEEMLKWRSIYVQLVFHILLWPI